VSTRLRLKLVGPRRVAVAVAMAEMEIAPVVIAPATVPAVATVPVVAVVLVRVIAAMATVVVA